jgi:hypothetical protein
VSFAERLLILSRLSASFVWLTAFDSRQSQSPVLIHSSNLYPLGNCVSLRSETNPSYLTRFGTASHRSSPLSPFFAFTDGARTPPEELVNPASSRFLRFDFEGLNQPAWLNLSPVTWDYP